MRNIITAALIAFTGVGCTNVSDEAIKNVRPIVKQEDQLNPNGPEKAVFKVWKDLVGNYRLIQFDGQTVTARDTKITQSSSRFYDRGQNIYLDSVIFPLFANVNSGNDMTYNFGPIDGKGTSSLTHGDALNVYSYKYDGPITLQGTDIEMNLDLSVIKDGAYLYVTYTLNVPGYISSTTHNFTLEKN